MKIEKLRNNHKKEIIIGTILTVVIGGALTYKLTHSEYRVTQSIDLGSGVINYKVPDFKIMAMYQQKDGSTCTEDNCYNEITDRMPSSGFAINTSKSYCTLDNVNHDNEVVLKTENGEHLFKNLKKSEKCYLYFDKIKITNVDSLIANSHINIGSPDFSKTATTDEGIFQASDGMYGGTTYYWRGATTTNHVIFAEKCWRIVRINGDKTLRLIYNGTPSGAEPKQTCPGNGANANAVYFPNNNNSDSNINLNRYATTGNDYNNASYVGWTYSLGSQRPASTTSGTDLNAKVQTEKWYKTNILDKGFDEKVADGKYCNDRDVGRPLSSDSGYVTSWSATGTKFRYAGIKRLYESYNPTFYCPTGDVYTLKVGLITADEVEFAGGKNENNASYYLYNGQNYWTMSPSDWDGAGAVVYLVNTYGYLLNVGVTWTDSGLRPVINLKADTKFASGGKGTQNNPYVVQ